MASPQKENGHTPIANEIIEALIRSPLRGRELKIVLFILRKTYGYSKKECKLSYSEIANAIGIKRQAVAMLVKTKLSPYRVIAVIPEGDRCKQVFIFNKNYDDWDFDLSPHRSTPHVPLEGDSSVPPWGDSKKTTPLYENNKTKKKIKKENVLRDFQYPSWLDKKLWAEFCKMRTKIKKPITSDIAIKRLINALKKTMDMGYSQEDVVGCALEKCWQSFYDPKGFKTEKTRAEIDAERDKIIERLTAGT